VKKEKYTCGNCGKVHEEWPALAFDSPTGYNVLSESKKQEIGELSSDFCIIRHPDQTDRYIRATLTIQVNDHCDNLEYGIWVSFSEKSYKDYSENYDNSDHEAKYFGWLSNEIPEYDFSEGSVPTTVFTRKNGLRPEVVPHEDFDHQLVRDYYEGISKREAEKRIEDMINSVKKRNQEQTKTKSWWKLF
jgi:hypothetical protein